MLKEDVIIEQIDFENPNRIAVIPFDITEKRVIGTVIEVNNREKVKERYNVIGELVNGEIRYTTYAEEEEFDYESYSGIIEEDD